MTYADLLKETAEKKRKALGKFNSALSGKAGFLVKAEIERKPGSVAWLYLAKEFCETLAAHVEEFIEQAGGVDTPEAREIGDIYMKYEEGDPDLYDYLPTQARLFDEED